MKSEVEQGLAAIDAGKLAIDSPEAQSFEAKLDEASQNLKTGHDGLPRCDAAVNRSSGAIASKRLSTSAP